LAGVAVVLLVLPAIEQPDWKRQFVATTRLSLELPGALAFEGEESVEGATGWVRRSTDFAYSDDDVYVQVTIFEGDPGAPPDRELLATMMDDIVMGMVAREESLQTLEERSEEIDGSPSMSKRIRFGSEAEPVFAHATLAGAESRVFVVIVMSVSDHGPAAEKSARIAKSVRLSADAG